MLIPPHPTVSAIKGESELLGLLCFVEPEHIDDYEVSDYLESFNELMSNEAVLNFFTSLMNWGNQIT